jgi:hypothetical protein
MRHTVGTGWIEEADARQMCLEAAERAHPADHHLPVRKALRIVAIALPLGLAVIGGRAMIATNSGSPAHFDCSGFPAVACHMVQNGEM